MSVDQGTNTERVIYVKLLDEGTDVWRPAPATELSDGTFQLGEPNDYDPDVEVWEFPPYTRVKCALRKFSDGVEGLVAVAEASCPK